VKIGVLAGQLQEFMVKEERFSIARPKNQPNPGILVAITPAAITLAAIALAVLILLQQPMKHGADRSDTCAGCEEDGISGGLL
jgi:hypothetical protein